MALFAGSVAPRFRYDALSTEPVSTVEVGVSLIIALVPVLWMPLRYQRPSSLLYWLLYVLLYVPAVMLPAFVTDTGAASRTLFQLALLTCFSGVGLIYRLPLVRLPELALKARVFWLGFTGVYALLNGVMLATYGLPDGLPSLADIYLVRDQFVDQLAGAGRLGSMGPRWLLYVLNPALIAAGLLNRKVLLVVLGIIGELWIFSISGFRSALFMPLLVAALMIPVRRKHLLGAVITVGALGLLGTSVAIDKATDTGVGTGLIARRAVMVPGVLTGLYFEFFREHPKIHMSNNTRFGILTEDDYPYHLPPSNLIGGTYFGSEETSANVNLWGDGYANYGYPGVLLMTAVLALFLHLYDSASRGLDPRLPGVLLGVGSAALSNSAVLGVLIGHGLGLAWILVYLMPKHAATAPGEGP